MANLELSLCTYNYSYLFPRTYTDVEFHLTFSWSVIYWIAIENLSVCFIYSWKNTFTILWVPFPGKAAGPSQIYLVSLAIAPLRKLLIPVFSSRVTGP